LFALIVTNLAVLRVKSVASGYQAKAVRIMHVVKSGLLAFLLRLCECAWLFWIL